MEDLKVHLSFCRLLFRAASKTISAMWDSAEVCSTHTQTHTHLITETTLCVIDWLRVPYSWPF